MMKIFSSYPSQGDLDDAIPDPERMQQEGCWKKPMHATTRDWLGNVHPQSPQPDRRFFHDDGAPAAEISGQEDLW
ncbi:MAG: hypothetical protein HQL84_10000 [Magnetococcales bacterium]|nr:hypothetical protein [Magnetococcales bacterium]MBF0150363.1 hypothetical protein [Magnetococcales bacterium]MBF0632157.1 hypothetical protein [Magnetococcales bacterium]